MEKPLHTAFKALGHPKRLEILHLLIQRVHTCCQINENQECCLEEPTCNFGALVNELEISKSSLSLHLKELRQAGLVEAIRNGREVSLQVNPKRLETLKEFFDVSIDSITRQWMEEVY